MVRIFEILLVVAFVSGSFASGKFDYTHEHDESDMDLDVEDVHIDGDAHVVAKTCFPVTMEVCLPSDPSNQRPNASTISTTPTQSPYTSAIPHTFAPLRCVNDRMTCPEYWRDYCSDDGVTKECFDYYNGESTGEPRACSLNCDPNCPAGSCTQCDDQYRYSLCLDPSETPFSLVPRSPECFDDAYTCYSAYAMSAINCIDDGVKKRCINSDGKSSGGIRPCTRKCDLAKCPGCVECIAENGGNPTCQ